MQQCFEIFSVTRSNILSLFEKYDHKELCYIPEGFNNNIIWNMGHVLTVQDALTYGLSGLPGNIGRELVDRFKKGTKGDSQLDSNVIFEVKSLLKFTATQLISDYKSGKFLSYNKYLTSYGYAPKSIQEGVLFNNVHEALHLGYMMAIGKCINNPNK